MWTVDAQKQTGPNGSRLIALIYQSDSGFASVVDRIEVSDTITQDYLSVLAKARVDQLNAQDQAYAALVDGPITLKDPPPPDKDAIARAQYFNDVLILDKLNAAVDNGTLDASDPVLVAQQIKVKTEFKPEYVGLPK